MAEIPPLLVFDSPVILAGRLALWQEWARFGVCVLPQAVMAELERLSRQAIDPQEESTAREFLRHWPSLGFAVSEARALVGGAGAGDQSMRVRLEEAIAECAYALAQQQPGTLVVLVSNDRPLVGRIQGLGLNNLCAISLAELNRWMRQQQRPQAVVMALNRLPGPPIPAAQLASSTLPPPARPLSSSPASGNPRPGAAAVWSCSGGAEHSPPLALFEKPTECPCVVAGPGFPLGNRVAGLAPARSRRK